MCFGTIKCWITKNPYNGNLEFYNYKRVDEYYDILWNILVVPPIICTEEYEEYTE
jgi:hypothetical protein